MLSIHKHGVLVHNLQPFILYIMFVVMIFVIFYMTDVCLQQEEFHPSWNFPRKL